MTRRDFLHHLLLIALGLAGGGALARPAFASDDGGGDDHGDDHDGGGDGGDSGGDDGDADGGDTDGDGTDDHDEALSSRQAGEAMPVHDMVERLQTQFGGEIIDIRLVSQFPTIYDIKMVNAAGRVGNVSIDAKTSKILRVTGF